MRVEIAEHSGFCFGVKNTIKKIEESLAAQKDPVYSVGLPVHNAQLTDKLRQQGLIIVDSIDEIAHGCMIVRAHGLPPADIRKLAEKGVTIIDATCLFVKKAQEIATELNTQEYLVIVCGEKEHPEVKAIEGCLTHEHYLCSSVSDLPAINARSKVALLTQTTHSPSVFHAVAKELAGKKMRELRIFNTICESVEKRKEFTANLASRVDVMFVVGGKMSSNTKRLFETAVAHNPRTYHIETSREIKDEWLSKASSVGISAGASTPDWIIEEVAAYLATA
jgi:4-hydroxy-3-methylbut-2-enyl diphosphate reductase